MVDCHRLVMQAPLITQAAEQLEEIACQRRGGPRRCVYRRQLALAIKGTVEILFASKEASA